jgi:elongation factor G
MGMLSSRRGRIEGSDMRFGAQIIRAKVPLAEMFGYSTTLRSGTQGRGVFSMELSHYEEVPKNISEEIISKYKGKE